MYRAAVFEEEVARARAFQDAARQASDEAGLRIGDAAIAALIARHQSESAERLLARIRHLLDRGGEDPTDDRTVLILKRRA